MTFRLKASTIFSACAFISRGMCRLAMLDIRREVGPEIFVCDPLAVLGHHDWPGFAGPDIAAEPGFDIGHRSYFHSLISSPPTRSRLAAFSPMTKRLACLSTPGQLHFKRAPR